MAAAKYLAHVAGRIKEVFATIVSAGAGDDGKIVALDATGKLDLSVLPTGIGPDTKTVTTSEALLGGDFVNIWNNAGSVRVRKADGSASGKEANGFVLASYASGASATVYLGGINNQCSGHTGGRRMYISAASPGLPTDTPPTAANNVVQAIGTSLSGTEVVFQPQESIILA